MCLSNCKQVANESDITCYKYVVIKHDKDSKYIAICSPFHSSYRWRLGQTYYSHPLKEDYPNSDNGYRDIGIGFFHVMSSPYRAIDIAKEFNPDEEDDIMAVIQCTIPDKHKADTYYGDVNGSGDVGYATNCLKTEKIIYLDKPKFSWCKYCSIGENIRDYKRYRKRMKAYNEIKKEFNLDESNCYFGEDTHSRLCIW